MTQPRKDPKGKILRKGENYNPQRNNYRYTYTDSFGTRHSLFAKTLSELREKIDKVYDAFIAERSYQQTTGITCNINIDGYTNFIFLNRFNQIYNQNSVNRASQ